MEFAIRHFDTGGLARRVFRYEEITHLHFDLELFGFDGNGALGGRTNTSRSTSRITNYF
jgi:hypothetical protein